MSLNKNVLIISLLGSLCLLVLFNSDASGLCNLYCGPAIDKYQNIFLLFPLVLFFSLVTLFINQEVFTAWWKFARIAIPIVLVSSFILSLGLHHHPGGWFNIDNEIDLSILSLMYLIFILGSGIQIYRGFKNRSKTL